ncbi:GD23966 [Drosophila simulans]|uniref:GD23966 n=1 Tax=Drosophila simulans TaxID=7240 RepID=B4Q5K3_DROSI|nr:GD23966 [Drosophila simulans]
MDNLQPGQGKGKELLQEWPEKCPTVLQSDANSQLSTMTRPGLWLKTGGLRLVTGNWELGLLAVMYTFVSLTACDVDVDVDEKPGFSLMFDA